MVKQVDRLHLVYGYVICGILVLAILVCWILSCTGQISRTAFDNFAFASSIVSIVLAVVSIVHSIHSNSGVVNSVGVLKETEESIRQQVEALKGIEKEIISKVEEGDRGITDQISCVQKQVDAILLQSNDNAANSSNEESSNTIINLKTNSSLGNLCVYICLRSAETGKAWNLDMLDERFTQYLWGYIFAMKAIPTFGFSCSFKGREVSDCVFSEKAKRQISREDIKEALEQSKSAEIVQSLLAKVDTYFESDATK